MEHGPAAADHAMASMGPMGHEMSDPAMAREMEADMRTRFFVSFVLTIPIILYSSLGTTLFHLHLPSAATRSLGLRGEVLRFPSHDKRKTRTTPPDRRWAKRETAWEVVGGERKEGLSYEETNSQP